MAKWKDQLDEKGKLTIKDAKDALSAVNEKVEYIKYVPAEFITAEIVDKCLKKGLYKEVLEYVPGELIPQEFVGLCIEAVKVYRMNQKARSFKDRVEAAELADHILVEHSRTIPGKFWTAELTQLCLELVTNRGINLKYVPEDRITAQMCDVAVKNDYLALEYVPDSFKTVEMCLAAVRNSIRAFQYVPDNLKTPEMCLIAVKANPDAIEYVPEHLITDEIKALTKEDAPATFPGMETPEAAIKTMNETLQHIPPEMRKTAIKANMAVLFPDYVMPDE